MSRLGKQGQRMSADSGHHQQDNVDHGNRERDAQYPAGAVRMPVSGVGMHITRIAQARAVLPVCHC